MDNFQALSPLVPGKSQLTNSPSTPIRKWHRKSRQGCYNCKRRRIKCPENPPSCHNCIKVKQDCEYPKERSRQEVHPLVPYLLETVHLLSTPIKFNMTDMRLFNHFFLNAYPHLPMGNDEVWVTHIASFAHSYDFLVHSVLGLAASHLTMVSTSPLSAVALSHRILAIKGLNEAMSQPPKISTESDAILAACYALAMQSSYIGESIEEFLTLLHGCQVVMAQHWPERLGSAFHSLDSDCQLQITSSKLSCLPTVASHFVEPAKSSVEQLGPLCESTLGKRIQGQLLDTVVALNVSSREAYFNYSTMCASLSALPQSEFEAVIDTSNPVMQILLAHWAAVLVLIYPIKACEWKGRDMGIPNRGTVFQLDSIYNNVPPRLRQYLKWPLRATGSKLTAK